MIALLAGTACGPLGDLLGSPPPVRSEATPAPLIVVAIGTPTAKLELTEQPMTRPERDGDGAQRRPPLVLVTGAAVPSPSPVPATGGEAISPPAARSLATKVDAGLTRPAEPRPEVVAECEETGDGAPQLADQPLPGVADAERGNWAIRLDRVQSTPILCGAAANRRARGVFVVVTYTASNKGKQTSILNAWDFTLKTADGAKFSPSAGRPGCPE